MEAKDVILFLTTDSSMSMRVASQKMGRSPTYLSTTRQLGVVPSVSVMAEIADVYDYDLLLRNRFCGDEIIIDPPQKD